MNDIAQKLESEMISVELTFGGATAILDPSGVIFFKEYRTLVVADLHFEKAAAFARRRGLTLPPYDTRETLIRLERTINKLKPERMIALGDTWHDPQGQAGMSAADAIHFARLRNLVDWIFIAGNHDPTMSHEFGAVMIDHYHLGAIRFRHEPSNEPGFEIAGHLHPVAKIKGRGRLIRRRCFVADERRLILPSFGAYTGGLNVKDTTFQVFFSEGRYSVHMLGADRLYAVPPKSLLPD